MTTPGTDESAAPILTVDALMEFVGEGVTVSAIPPGAETTETIGAAIRSARLFSDGLRLYPRSSPFYGRAHGASS